MTYFCRPMNITALLSTLEKYLVTEEKNRKNLPPPGNNSPENQPPDYPRSIPPNYLKYRRWSGRVHPYGGISYKHVCSVVFVTGINIYRFLLRQ